jgi:hypothetical protein
VKRDLSAIDLPWGDAAVEQVRAKQLEVGDRVWRSEAGRDPGWAEIATLELATEWTPKRTPRPVPLVKIRFTDEIERRVVPLHHYFQSSWEIRMAGESK